MLTYGRSGSVWVDDTTSINRIFNGTLTYTKGGFILHMLRNQIGDEPFFAALNEMLTNERTSGGFARAEDVKLYLEEAADTNLTWFFDQWYYGEGYPIYSIKVHKSTSDSLTFSINQSTTHTSVEFYKMDIPLRLIGSNNELNIKVRHTENGQIFSVKTGFQVNSIVFDQEDAV